MKKLFSCCLLIALFVFSTQALNAQATADIKAPVIEEIKVLTPTVMPGEKLKIQVKISDDSSGLDYVRALFFSPSQAHNIMPIIYADKEDPLTNTYILESEVMTDTLEQGKWQLNLIQTKDSNQNIGNYNVNNTKSVNLKNISFHFGLTAPQETPSVSTNTPKDVGFKTQKARNNVAIDGEFTFTFNTDVAVSTFTKKNIYITDKNSVNIPLIFVIERDVKTKKSTITIAPVNSYDKNSTYTLYIKDIHSKTGKNLKQHTKMNFTTKK